MAMYNWLDLITGVYVDFSGTFKIKSFYLASKKMKPFVKIISETHTLESSKSFILFITIEIVVAA